MSGDAGDAGDARELSSKKVPLHPSKNLKEGYGSKVLTRGILPYGEILPESRG